MVLTKGGTTTSIPATVFVNAAEKSEMLEIEINELEKDSDDIVEVENESDKGEGSIESEPEENVVEQTFPASSGFKVNEAAAQVTLDTKRR